MGDQERREKAREAAKVKVIQEELSDVTFRPRLNANVHVEGQLKVCLLIFWFFFLFPSLVGGIEVGCVLFFGGGATTGLPCAFIPTLNHPCLFT